MEQSGFSLKQREQSYEAFHKHFKAKIYILFVGSQFLLKIIFFIVYIKCKNMESVKPKSENLFQKWCGLLCIDINMASYTNLGGFLLPCIDRPSDVVYN